jgi:dihydroorotate dehydrogenase
MPVGSSVISFFGHMEPPEEIKKEILGLELLSPVGLNGRLDPDLQAFQAMAQFSFGFLTVGPVKLKPVKEVQVRRNKSNEEIGYEQLHANRGLEATYKYLSNLNKHGCKLMVRVCYQGDVHELHVLMDRLLAIADLFIIEGIDEVEGPFL